MKIRGHHLLCIQGFQGTGYSPAFVLNFNEIVTAFRNDAIDFPVFIMAGQDQVCQNCPHDGGEFCASDNDKVLSFDHRVLNQLNLEVGKVYMKNELMMRVARDVDPDDLDYLCKGCSWLEYGVCKAGIKHIKNDSRYVKGTNEWRDD